MYSPSSYSIDWGDGTPATTANEVLSQIGDASYPASHVYTAPGIYYVQAYGGDGSWASAFLTVSPVGITMDPVPDQAANPAGGPLTVTTTVSGLRSGDVGFATVDWGDGHGPQAASVQFNGTTATITATASSSDDLAAGDQATLTFDDPDSEASQNFGFYQVNLSIAGDGGTSTDSDPAIIPVDDGYDSATQSVPNDELTIPDAADPALVPATITLTAPTLTSATWSLDFPSSVRAFVLQDGSLTPLTSGLASSPVNLQDGGEWVQLELEGVSADNDADLTATITPLTERGESPMSPAPSLQSFSDDAGKIAPTSLEAMAVDNNAPGAVLTAAQEQAGIYLPMSAPVANGVGGVIYKLPIVIHDLAAPARLQVPKGWFVLDSTGKMLQTGGDGLLLPAAPNSDTDLFIEATAAKIAPAAGTPSDITLTQVSENSLKLGHYTVGATLVVTPFQLPGPLDVPQYGTYDYTVKNVPNGQWVSASTQPGTGGKMTVNPANPDDATIQWGAGPFAATAVYQADAQYVWDMPVNIFEITVATPTNAAAATGGTPKGTSVGAYVSVTVTILTMNAAFTITGPNGTQGLSHIGVGFIQNGSPITTQATYRRVPNDPTTAKSYALASHTFNNQLLDGNTFWDTQGYNVSNKLYNTEAVVKGSASRTIWTVDAPQVVFPQSFPGSGNIFSDTVVWNMTMYVVGFTDEAPATFVPQASLGWTFNGSGTFPNNKWQTNGGGVTYRTPAGQTLPLAQAVWTATGGPVAAFTTAAPQFNYLIQADPKLNPQLQIPPVYLAPIT